MLDTYLFGYLFLSDILNARKTTQFQKIVINCADFFTEIEIVTVKITSNVIIRGNGRERFMIELKLIE